MRSQKEDFGQIKKKSIHKQLIAEPLFAFQPSTEVAVDIIELVTILWNTVPSCTMLGTVLLNRFNKRTVNKRMINIQVTQTQH